jgi:hypothetical protein
MVFSVSSGVVAASLPAVFGAATDVGVVAGVVESSSLFVLGAAPGIGVLTVDSELVVFTLALGVVEAVGVVSAVMVGVMAAPCLKNERQEVCRGPAPAFQRIFSSVKPPSEATNKASMPLNGVMWCHVNAVMAFCGIMWFHDSGLVHLS